MNVNIVRIHAHIDALANFTATPGAGSTRLSFSSEYRAACDYLINVAESSGLSARFDAIGNLRIRLDGAQSNLPVVVVGSHIDTVIHGGNFDGILGVVSGLEILSTLVEENIQPIHPIEVVNFVEEEGTTFRCPLTGSKALTGQLDEDALKTLKDDDGRTFHEAAIAFGLDPSRLDEDRFYKDTIKSMLELHIEQGAVLESLGIPVGIVNDIAGSENYRIRLYGRANHAGTTPMSLRFDSLACAAECITLIERIARDPKRTNTVATVGRISCLPNAVNVIPASVEFSIDVRDTSEDRIEDASKEILHGIEAIAHQRNIRFEWELTAKSTPKPMSPSMVAELTVLSETAGIASHIMTSGALHDAAMMSDIAPTAMIFVPSKDGRSHTPKESTRYEDIEHGANLLLAAVLQQAGSN
ncbi:MAG: Zn-dependent hydrolase [marine bacterium B5-7]|nr:MAG: Zn-dependent hydrolase [marine bacterium B5-7]